jgi:hypothetical protein
MQVKPFPPVSGMKIDERLVGSPSTTSLDNPAAGANRTEGHADGSRLDLIDFHPCGARRRLDLPAAFPLSAGILFSGR